VTSTLRQTGLAPERLELEITESLFLADNDHNLNILHALRNLGVRIALDDFGTGYSSLSYLRSFPFDKIKIDRTFISDLSEQKETEAIVTAVLQIGSSFGMSTTAEGVENEAQLEFVRAHGCTEVQGYLFSRPLTQIAIGEFLAAAQSADSIAMRSVG
jgi:EAL domain-containing protein (putative c-di-GMP-specific phosphodiesterase class I)